MHFLLRYGELSLKGENRARFERQLCDDIRRKLRGLDVQLYKRWGRILLSGPADAQDRIRSALECTFGLVAFAPAWIAEKTIEGIEVCALNLVETLLAQAPGSAYKIEARRTDKSFPLTSYEIACRLGDALKRRFPELKVKCGRPDWILHVEARDRVYLYGPETRCPGGLPAGSSGRGLLLLSGGIDSPVAGYLMAKRGLIIDAVYFHTPPYTSERALEKVEKLCGLLARYLTSIRLFVVPFTEVQTRIKEAGVAREMTLIMRAAMMSIADRLARREGSQCLITGESLGQVASQTAESLRFTGHVTGLSIFRPLIGMDKEEIIALARRIGTFETSILPYQDCCTLFAPRHPLIRPPYVRMVERFTGLGLEPLLEQAVRGVQTNDYIGS